MHQPDQRSRYTTSAKAKRKAKAPTIDTSIASDSTEPSAPAPPALDTSGREAPHGALRDRHGHAPQLAVGMDEAARILGIGKRKVWELTNRGLIPHIRIDARVLYPLEELRAWLSEQCCRTSASKRRS